MKLRYSYHSEHNAGPQDTYLHFVYFATALLFILLAWFEVDTHFKTWTSAGDPAYDPLLWMTGYVIAAGLFILMGIRTNRASKGEADRYVRINDEELIWDLTQVDGVQKVKLADLARVDRRNIRDLQLTLKSGEIIVLPIYLIGNHEKQEELRVLLGEILAEG